MVSLEILVIYGGKNESGIMAIHFLTFIVPQLTVLIEAHSNACLFATQFYDHFQICFTHYSYVKISNKIAPDAVVQLQPERTAAYQFVKEN